MSGSEFAAGAYFASNYGMFRMYYFAGLHFVGEAYVFTYSRDAWSQQANLQSDDKVTNNFGWSVSIDTNYLIVGAYGDDTKGQDAGNTHTHTIYTYVENMLVLK